MSMREGEFVQGHLRMSEGAAYAREPDPWCHQG